MEKTNAVIDLHMHSINSDGTCSTQEILDMLSQKDVGIFSFTDHDSVGCYYDLRNGEAKLYPNVVLIPGVELSCRYKGDLRDMLGYGIDVDEINDFLNKRYSKEHRIEKQQSILERLKEICREQDLIFDEGISVKDGKKAEGFVTMYNELNKYLENVEKFPFIANNTRFYWDYFQDPDSVFYVDETFDLPSFEEAVDEIHKAGGLAFLAHPFAYGMPLEGVEDLVKSAVEAGIDGIELKHSSNKDDDVSNVRAFAKQYGLLMSGGTDFHGATKPGLELVTGYGNMLVQLDDIKNWISSVDHIGEIDEDIYKLWS